MIKEFFKWNAALIPATAIQTILLRYEHTSILLTIIISAALIIVISLCHAITFNNLFQKIKKKYKLKISELNDTKTKLDNTKNDILHKNEEIESLSSALTESKQTVNSLREALAVYTKNPITSRIDNEQALLSQEAITQLHSLAIRGKTMTCGDWHNIEKLFIAMLPKFYNFLIDKKHVLTEQEYITCFLTRLKFTPSETACLLGISQQRSTNIRASINTKLFNKKGATGLFTNIAKI